MTLYAAPMLKADAWCVRSRFDGQLVASYLNRADAEAIAQRGATHEQLGQDLSNAFDFKQP
jgi:hypothetical protein